MGIGDLPANYEAHTKVSEYRSIEDDSRDRLSVDALYLLAEGRSRKTGEKMKAEIENVGAIDQMKLPAGFVKGAEQDGIAGSGSTKQYLAAANKDVEITLFNHGRRYSSNAEAFKELLAKPPHVLSPAELKSLSTLLGNYADVRAFKMTSCSTQELNGKHVLVIEGKWNANGHESYSLLVNPDGEGETVQEIYFKAPANEYKANLHAAQDAMKSIRWK